MAQCLRAAGGPQNCTRAPSGSVAQPLRPSNGQSVTDGVNMPEPLKKEVRAGGGGTCGGDSAPISCCLWLKAT